MARVDFYILEDMDRQAMLRFACRLAAKALSAGRLVHVHADGEAQAADFDELLWCYPAHRLVPHGVIGTAAARGAPVTVGSGSALAQVEAAQTLLINLADAPLDCLDRFARAAEILVEETRAAGRARYRRYRELGHQLEYHEMRAWEGA